jgi:ATP-dependent helicase/nuclease subunit B
MSTPVRGLLEGPAPRVRTIPPGSDFFLTLAQGLRDAADPADPFALADALVLLPNRRAVRALMDAFARVAPGAALLPSIQPLGDLADDPDTFESRGEDGQGLDLPPAVEPLRRRLELAALIRARAEAEGGVNIPARAIAAADELAALLDSAAAAEVVDWSLLPTLVEEKDLAEHWQGAAKFLEIITHYWPQRLAADGLMDQAARGAAMLRRLAQDWAAKPPPKMIVIAGSTGSQAATRALMRTVAHLPKGVVILPGLDADLDEEAWAEITPDHPQATMKATVAALEIDRADVAPFAAEVETPAALGRRLLLRETLAPPDRTADWVGRIARLRAQHRFDPITEGLNGVELIDCETAEEEASVIALRLRACLETPGRTAMLVTPDADLARRVSTKLARWGVAAPASSGFALRDTSLGALIELVLDLVEDEAEPLTLAGVVTHPLVRLGFAEQACAAGAASMVQVLRGLRAHRDLAGLAKAAAEKSVPADFVARLLAAMGPLQALAEEVTLDAVAAALIATLDHLCTDEAGDNLAWAGRAGEAAARALSAMTAEGAALGPMRPVEAARTVSTLMRGAPVSPEGADHPRLAILGALEARLQRRDLVILGGLNEGMWPKPPTEDPFLTRSMRAALGLQPLEVRLGLAAHDFAQLAQAPQLTLTRAMRVGGSPSVASRWIWRLRTLARGVGCEAALDPPPADDPRRIARAMDARQPRAPAPAPTPRPPQSARPAALSFTEVERLIRDPYGVYARRVLGLRILDPIGMAFGPAARGTILHAALEAHVKARLEGRAPDAAALLDDIQARFAAVNLGAAELRMERARMADAAAAFVAWDAATAATALSAHLEKLGGHDFDGFRLYGKADRIDITAQGAVIIDYKTGEPPTDKQVDSGLNAQLPLEAAVLRAGGFDGLAAQRVDALIYWRFSGSRFGPRTLNLEGGVDAASARALEGLAALIAAYQDPAQPFLSKPRAWDKKDYADFDHLARRDEWADAEGLE